MPKYPYRDLGTGFDRNFRNDLNANFDDIESDFKEADSRMTQIENDSIQRDNDLDARIDNIIAQSGTSDTEVVDARYDSRTSTTHPTLKDRLDAHSNEIGILFKRSDWVSVKEFGAKGDGITDDSPAINSAIQAVNNNGGGIVYLPPGKYLINSTIELKYDGVHLLGAGYGEPNSPQRTAEIIKNFNGIGIRVQDTGGGQTLRWSISNLALNGNNKTGDGIYVYNAHYGYIRDVTVFDNITDGIGVHFNLSYSNRLDNVQSFRNNINFKFENQSHDICGTRLYSSTATNEGFYITTSNALSFYGCTHEGSATYGIRIDRLVKGCVFDGFYGESYETNGITNYFVFITESVTTAYQCRNIAFKNAHFRINTNYKLPIVIRSGVWGATIENINIEFNGCTIDSNSRGVLVGWAVGAVEVKGVIVKNVHVDLVNCTGSGIGIVGAAENVVDGGLEVVGCTSTDPTAFIGLGGQHQARNGTVTTGNYIGTIDFINLKPQSAPPTYIKVGAIVYADGTNWNPGNGEGLYRCSSAGTWVFVG